MIFSYAFEDRNKHKKPQKCFSLILTYIRSLKKVFESFCFMLVPTNRKTGGIFASEK